MTPRHPSEDLTALVDGALPEARAAEVRAHVEACPTCRAARDRLAATAATFARLPAAPEPSPLFATRLAARLASASARPERAPSPARPELVEGRASRWLGRFTDLSSLRWRLAAPAAAAALAAGVVVVAVRAQRAEEAAMATHLDLLLEYEAVASLDLVESAEDVAVVTLLDELAPAGGTP